MRKILLLIGLTWISNLAIAQEKFTINGTVKDKTDHLPIGLDYADKPTRACIDK